MKTCYDQYGLTRVVKYSIFHIYHTREMAMIQIADKAAPFLQEHAQEAPGKIFRVFVQGFG